MQDGSVTVRLLGGFDVRDPLGRPLDGRALHRASPLLKYLLALPDHAASRARIAAALWPGSERAAAATNLRVAVHWLKIALAGLPALDAHGGRLRLLPERWHIDADEFEANAAAVLSAKSSEQSALFALVKRYGGTFLADDSETEWIAPRRIRLASLYRDVLLRCLRTGDERRLALRSDAEAYARSFLDENRDDCEVTSALCDLLRASGSSSEAMRLELAHRNASAGSPCCCARAPAGPSDGPAPPAASPDLPLLWLRTEEPRFVGRAAEVARLGTLLDDTFSARGHTALLLGAPGIGKTRLAGETMAEAQDRGALTLAVTCERKPGTALHPFVRAIEAVTAALPDAALASVLRSNGPVLARVSSSLRARIGARDQEGAAADVSRVISAIVDLFTELARLWPIVVLVDDLHAADPASVAALSALAVAAPSARLLMIGTARAAEFRASLAADVLDAVRSGVSLLDLAPLTDSESLALARNFWDSPLEPRVVTRRAHGNPFAIMEFSRGAPGVQLEAAVVTRLERLPEVERAVIAVLALADPIPLCEASLTRTVGKPRIAHAIERLLASGLLRRQPDGYALAHGIFVDAIERTIDPSERAGIHGELAALGEVQRHPDATALHLLQAGERCAQQAISWTVRALKEAMSVRNAGALLDLLRAAFAMPGGDDGERYTLALGLGLAETFDGDAARARAALEQALRLARDPGEQADAYIALIELAETEMRVEDGLHLCDDAAACAAGFPSKDLAIRARRAFLLLLTGRFDEALAAAAALLDAGDELAAVRACNVTAIAHAYRGKRTEAVAWFNRASQGAQRIGAGNEAALVKLNLAAIYFHRGKLRSADAEYRRAATFALSHGRLSVASVSIRNAGECELYLGNLAEALACIDVAERRAARSGRPMLIAEARLLRGVALREQGSFAEALDWFERACRTFSENANAKLVIEAAAHALVACRRGNDAAPARRWLEIGRAAVESCADVDTRAFFYAGASLGGLLTSDPHRARADLRLALSDLDGVGAAIRRLEVAICAAEAARELDDGISVQAVARVLRSSGSEIDPTVPLLTQLTRAVAL